MSYLKPELKVPVRVEWDGEFPKLDTSKKYPRHIYNVKVDGEPMVFEATDNTHKKIQQFSQLNGNKFCIVKMPNPKYPDGTIYNIEPYDLPNAPQNADMYGQTGSQYAKTQKTAPKPEGEKDWDKINEEKDDKILKGQARNLAHAEYVAGIIKDEALVPRIVQLYHRFKNMDWEAEAKKPMPIKEEESPMPEEPPVFKGDLDLPF